MNLSSFKLEIKEGIVIRDITDKVISFVLKDSLITGGMDWNIKLLLSDVNEEDDFAFDLQVRQIRLTIIQQLAETTTGWRFVLLSKSQLYYENALPVITIIGNNLSLLLQKKNRIRAFHNVSLISVLESIAQDYNFLLKVDDNFDISNTWYQLNESDWSFLHRLSKEVVSNISHKKIFLYLNNKELHFSPLLYHAVSERNFGMGAGDDRVLNVAFSDNIHDIDLSNGNSPVGLTFDILNKNILHYKIPSGLIPSLATRLPQAAQANGVQYKIYAQQNVALQKNQFYNDWICSTSKYISMQCTVPADLTIMPKQVISINVVDSKNNYTPFNGKYPVYEVVHAYQSDTEEFIQTFIGGFRRSFFYGNVQSDGVNLSRDVNVDDYAIGQAVMPAKVTKIAKEI